VKSRWSLKREEAGDWAYRFWSSANAVAVSVRHLGKAAKQGERSIGYSRIWRENKMRLSDVVWAWLTAFHVCYVTDTGQLEE